MDPETIKFITELSKSLVQSVYGDTLSPAFREIGGFLSDVAKTLRIALPQIQMSAVEQDRYRRFLETSYERVPEGERIAPAPQLLGPIIEGIRYEPEGSISDEAFSELLTRAFDRERVGQAHPSFPSIIRSLSDDEFEILRRIENKPAQLEIGRIPLSAISHNLPSEHVQNDFAYLRFPAQVKAVLTHLEAVGLLNDLHPSISGFYGEGPYKNEKRVVWDVALSDLGYLFIQATSHRSSE